MGHSRRHGHRTDRDGRRARAGGPARRRGAARGPAVAAPGFVALGLAQLVPLPARGPRPRGARVARGVASGRAGGGRGPRRGLLSRCRWIPTRRSARSPSSWAWPCWRLWPRRPSPVRGWRRRRWPRWPRAASFSPRTRSSRGPVSGRFSTAAFTVPTVAPFGPFVSKNHFAGYVVMAALLAAGLAIGLADGARGRSRDWTTSSRRRGSSFSPWWRRSPWPWPVSRLSRGEGEIALAAGAAALVALLVLRGPRGKETRGPAAVARPRRRAGTRARRPRPSGDPRADAEPRAGPRFRLDTWRDGLRLALASPVVGSGLGAFHDAYPRFKRGHGLDPGGARGERLRRDPGRDGTGRARLSPWSGARSFSRVWAGGSPAGATAWSGAWAWAPWPGSSPSAVHSGVDFNLRIPSNAALAAVLAAAAAGAAGVRPRPLSRPVAAALRPCVLGLLAAVVGVARRALARRSRGGPPRRRGDDAGVAGASPRSGRDRAGSSPPPSPAHAESWLMLAGVRAAGGDPESAVSSPTTPWPSTPRGRRSARRRGRSSADLPPERHLDRDRCVG